MFRQERRNKTLIIYIILHTTPLFYFIFYYFQTFKESRMYRSMILAVFAYFIQITTTKRTFVIVCLRNKINGNIYQINYLIKLDVTKLSSLINTSYSTKAMKQPIFSGAQWQKQISFIQRWQHTLISLSDISVLTMQ